MQASLVLRLVNKVSLNSTELQFNHISHQLDRYIFAF